MLVKGKGAHIQKGHAEIIKDADGKEIAKTAELLSVDISEETAFLMTIDNLQDSEVKTKILKQLQDIHETRLKVIQTSQARGEARADRTNAANINCKYLEQIRDLIAYIILIAAFVYCQQHGATSSQLWAFSIFVAGGTGLYVFKLYNNRNNKK